MVNDDENDQSVLIEPPEETWNTAEITGEDVNYIDNHNTREWKKIDQITATMRKWDND